MSFSKKSGKRGEEKKRKKNRIYCNVIKTTNAEKESIADLSATFFVFMVDTKLQCDGKRMESDNTFFLPRYSDCD